MGHFIAKVGTSLFALTLTIFFACYGILEILMLIAPAEAKESKSGGIFGKIIESEQPHAWCYTRTAKGSSWSGNLVTMSCISKYNIPITTSEVGNDGPS